MPFILENYLEKYREILAYFPGIKVNVISSPASPFNLSIASARTCYSSKGLLMPDDMEKNTNLRDSIAESTMQAGHLTTRQHAHFILGIEGVSRNIIWQFLHSHPYYNSEQVSQRYVPIQGNNWYMLPRQLQNEEIAGFHEKSMKTYHDLIEALTPSVEEEFFSIYRSRKNSREKYKNHIQKKAMEIARYVMPLSTTAYMYHTISALTLYRYVRVMETFGNNEIIALVMKILIEINKVDPLVIREVPEPLARDKREESGYNPEEAYKANKLFDEKLRIFNTVSRLASSTHDPEILMREIGISAGFQKEIYDAKGGILESILNPRKNETLLDTLYPATLDIKSRILNHIHFTFQKKLSHSADSQEQRHRTLPGARPMLASQISLEPDYITPLMIGQIDKAKKIYDDYMEYNLKTVKKYYSGGVSLNDLAYLMPNAFPVRFYESGDFLNYFHKWKARLCYTSQEEIFYSTLDEVKQITAKFPFFEKYIGAPCALRKEIHPVCPEGDKYCGVKVWKIRLNQYSRKI